MKQPLMVHDSHNKFYRKPFGAVPAGTKIQLRLKVLSELKGCRVYTRLWVYGSTEEKIYMNQDQRNEEYITYYTNYTVPDREGLVWYYFVVETDSKIYYYGNNYKHFGGIGIISEYPPDSYQITVYSKEYKTPDWFKNSIMYQIFVDRFYKGENNDKLYIKKDCIIHNNWFDMPDYKAVQGEEHYEAKDFFGGNLKGIIEKLQYLKELGIDVLYLNPIFEAFSNHKYDTGDYYKIDSMFGDINIFTELCIAAKAYGISIILDGVFNHTGSDSVYFNKNGNYTELGAYESKESKYYPWYNFKKYPDEYESWWGIKTLPQINELQPSYTDFIIENEDSVVKHYLKAGTKGWRLDVVDELPDEFVKKLRKAVKSVDDNNVLIGEVWEDASNKISYGLIREYFLGNELDSVMNYPLRSMLFNFLLELCDAENFNQGIMSLYENYPLEAFYSLMNLMSSHDTVRMFTALSGAPSEGSLNKDEKASYKLSEKELALGLKRAKLAAFFQMTFPGVPCVYYGDEAGLDGYTDPFNRKTYPWGKENRELIDWYKKIIKIRHEIDALRTGNFVPVYFKNGVYGFLRTISGGRDKFGNKKDNSFNIILINRDDRSREICVNLTKWGIDCLYDLLNDKKHYKVHKGRLKINIDAMDGIILSCKY